MNNKRKIPHSSCFFIDVQYIFCIFLISNKTFFYLVKVHHRGLVMVWRKVLHNNDKSCFWTTKNNHGFNVFFDMDSLELTIERILL